MGANVSIKDIFFAKAIQENIPEVGKMAITNTMVLLDKESDVRCFIKFKAALRQSFLPPPLILLLQLKVMNIKTPAVGLGTIRIGLGTLRIKKLE